MKTPALVLKLPGMKFQHHWDCLSYPQASSFIALDLNTPDNKMGIMAVLPDRTISRINSLTYFKFISVSAIRQ